MTAPRYVLTPRPGIQRVRNTLRVASRHGAPAGRLGLVACQQDARGDLWFEPSALVTVARIQRLRTGLGLNYAAIGLVLDLLDRIEELESASRRRRTSPWTSTS